MVYKSNIPQPSDFISQSQVDMSENFEQIRKIWGQPADEQLNEGDHIPLNNPEDKFFGKHKKTTFVEQETAPTTLANEVALYTKDTNGKPELFYRRESDGIEAQLTDRGNVTVGGMVLGASVIFDYNGNILEKVDYDENEKKIKVPLAYNVSSVSQQTQNIGGSNVPVCEYIIGFSKPLPDNNYCWMVSYYLNKNGEIDVNLESSQAYFSAKNSALYSNSVTTTSLRLIGNSFKDSGSFPVLRFGKKIGIDRIVLQIYRVAG